MDKNKEQLISLSEASKIAPYSANYLGLLIRKGRLKGEKIEGKWCTTEMAVKNYLNEVAEANFEHQENLNVKVPAMEIKKNLLNMRWAILLFLLVIIGLAIINFEAKRSKISEYEIQKDQNNNLYIYVDDISTINSVSVLPKD